ncbi:hypothetical protein Bbelb_271050 [Branchiostoma belcheri]|nr:hypothetical protein Bbelb_271050 [Branchiostoma belcheri]
MLGKTIKVTVQFPKHHVRQATSTIVLDFVVGQVETGMVSLTRIVDLASIAVLRYESVKRLGVPVSTYFSDHVTEGLLVYRQMQDSKILDKSVFLGCAATVLNLGFSVSIFARCRRTSTQDLPRCVEGPQTGSLQGNGGSSKVVNKCAVHTDNCDLHTTCTNTQGSFTCSCIVGYTCIRELGYLFRFVLESSESDIPGAATLILSASTHRAGMGTTVKTESGEHVTTGIEPELSAWRFVLESSESDIPGAATLILSASTHRAGMGTTVKTESGEHVTTGNRTRVVRLAVTNANHYTKRQCLDLDHESSQTTGVVKVNRFNSFEVKLLQVHPATVCMTTSILLCDELK